VAVPDYLVRVIFELQGLFDGTYSPPQAAAEAAYAASLAAWHLAQHEFPFPWPGPITDPEAEAQDQAEIAERSRKVQNSRANQLERQAQEEDRRLILGALEQEDRHAMLERLREQNVQRGSELEELARSIGWPDYSTA
jgi:hypothetical protein